MDKLKNMKKTTKNNIITYALVIAAFVIMQSLINAGSISSLLEGLMVPLCIYIIMAVSLNLVVGVLGELSLGHAGFMCVGAFAPAKVDEETGRQRRGSSYDTAFCQRT